MSFEKFANAEVTDIISLKEWEKMHRGQSFKNKTAAVAKLAEDHSRYILSQVTIMSSVAVEADPFDHKIKPESAAFVNGNHDAWTNEVLAKSYHTFRGAFNFLEHYQNTKANKGHILDAIPRKIWLNKTTFILYIDLLVATSLEHEELVADIRSGKVKHMSMGCTTELVICSICGTRHIDNSTFCDHLRYCKGEFLLDNEGIPRITAELCGHKSLECGGIFFTESSWVANPAFLGSQVRHIIDENFLGPKTPYTRVASTVSGQKKVAAAPGPTDGRLRADFDRLFR